MELHEIIEARKEALHAAVSTATGPADLVRVLERIWDELTFRYLEECEEDALREEAAKLLRAAKSTAALSDVTGAPKLWEMNTSGHKKASAKRISTPALIVFLAGLLCAAVAAVLPIVRNEAFLTDRFTQIEMGLAALALLLVLFGSLFLRQLSAPPEKEHKIEITVDPDRVMRALRASALVLDEQLKETRDALSKEAAKERAAGALTPEELDLFSDLLAAKESGDGEYALEQLQDAAYFLHKKGVEAVSYDKEHAAFFDVLPGEESRTLRPALLGDDGELLKKGVAQGGI